MPSLTLERNIPLNEEYDVIAIGGGPAGCTAAAAAAREGAKTLLIEQTGALGGMGTSGLVPAWCPFSDKEKIIYRGMAERVFNASKAGMKHIDPERLDWVAIDPEHLKRVYDDLVTEAGAHVLFNTFMSGVECEDGRVSAVICSNKAGLTAYSAKTYVDCSGDADLAAWAGAEFEQGDEDGDLQPATHCFSLANVYLDKVPNGPLHPSNPNSPIHQIIADGKYPLIPDTHICTSPIGPMTTGHNAGHIWDVDNTKPETVSKALMHGRKIAKAFHDALAEYCPEAFGEAFLVQTGSLLGIRETRRVVGDYRLVIDDFLGLRSFEDEICRNSYYIDVHHTKDVVTRGKEGQKEWEKGAFRLKAGESHGIPYRCLTPKDLTNVLVAGRAISCDRRVQGSVRVMPVCLAMGEAVGMAAAMSAETDACDVHEVDTNRLRERLREEGGYLP